MGHAGDGRRRRSAVLLDGRTLLTRREEEGRVPLTLWKVPEGKKLEELDAGSAGKVRDGFLSRWQDLGASGYARQCVAVGHCRRRAAA